MSEPKARHTKPGIRFEAALRKHLQDENSLSIGDCADELLADAFASRTSDIHLDPDQGGVRVRFRIDGSLLQIASLEAETGSRLIRYFKTNSGLDPGTRIGPVDAHYEFETNGQEVDVRVAVVPCVTGEKTTLRLLPRSRLQMGLDELGLTDEDFTKITDWIHDTNGMFLVTGPTGSGKTTTLHALLRHMDIADHCVLSIEDPVEYRAEGVSQIQVDPSRGVTLASGLGAALRLDPDLILLGEIRDAESAKTGLEAAGSGHTIFTTIHSRSAAGAVTMLRYLGLADHEISTSLTFIISQRLVRTLCPDCKEEAEPTESNARWLRKMGVEEMVPFWEAKGCEKCFGTGYRGRTGVFEVCPFDESVYDMVLAGRDEAALRDQFRESGARSLLEDGLEKAKNGITTVTEIRKLGTQNHHGHSSP